MNRTDNFSKFLDLRKQFSYFSYDSYAWKIEEDKLEITYSFSLSGKYRFEPRISIPYKSEIFRPIDSLSSSVMDCLVFHTGVIELISYWKAACPEKLIIRPFNMTEAQVGFWKNVYYQGLGEFFYLNSIDIAPDQFMTVLIEGDSAAGPVFPEMKGGSLIPVGGGKDSAVTMGLLNRTGLNWLPMVINPGETTRNVISASGKDPGVSVEISREIHPELLRLNREGFLNGHTPFSALLAFYGLLAAYLTGRSEIVLSNESSANEATVPGTSINHQYSKSLSFEADFRDYVRQFISEEFNYFSLLRPLSELQIAGLFSQMPQYHRHFRSCNAGSKTGSWCGKCPKCLFTFIILSPFLSPDKLSAIFGRNLLDDPSLAVILEELTGTRETKPFECIGTTDEVNLALELSAGMYEPGNLPCLIAKHREQMGSSTLSAINFNAVMRNIEGDHFVPAKYMNLLKEAIQ